VLGALGLWDLSMATLGLTVSAVLISLLIGVPLGILARAAIGFQRLVSPVLDVMQIMPTFAYLARCRSSSASARAYPSSPR